MKNPRFICWEIFGKVLCVKKIFVLVALFGASFAYSQSNGGVYVPAGNGPMPHYFNGTKNNASGNAMVLPPPAGGQPAYFTHATLTVGSEVVKNWALPSGEPGPSQSD